MTLPPSAAFKAAGRPSSVASPLWRYPARRWRLRLAME